MLKAYKSSVLRFVRDVCGENNGRKYIIEGRLSRGHLVHLAVSSSDDDDAMTAAAAAIRKASHYRVCSESFNSNSKVFRSNFFLIERWNKRRRRKKLTS